MAQVEVDFIKELKEIKNTVEELKRAVVEIKATLADLTGPFSMYKHVEGAERPPIRVPLETGTVHQEAPSVMVEKPGREATQIDREIGEKPVKPMETVDRGGVSRVITGISEVLREERARLTESELKKTLNMMKVLYELRKLYPRSSIESILKILEEMRAFSQDEINMIKAAVNLVEESLKENISNEENVLMMFMLMRQLGVRSEELEEEALKTILDVLASKRRKQALSGDIGINRQKGTDEWASPQQ